MEYSKKTFLISDLHLGDDRIIKYTSRPFSNMKEMSDEIIKRWNSVVEKGDEVFVLGDVTFYHDKKTKNIITSLNGDKILIMGNHDEHLSISEWVSIGFREVYKHPIIYKKRFILSHQPLYKIADQEFYFNIHGHIHHHKPKIKAKNMFNCCCEVVNYTPVGLEYIKRIWNVK